MFTCKLFDIVLAIFTMNIKLIVSSLKVYTKEVENYKITPTYLTSKIL